MTDADLIMKMFNDAANVATKDPIDRLLHIEMLLSAAVKNPCIPQPVRNDLIKKRRLINRAQDELLGIHTENYDSCRVQSLRVPGGK